MYVPRASSLRHRIIFEPNASQNCVERAYHLRGELVYGRGNVRSLNANSFANAYSTCDSVSLNICAQRLQNCLTWA